MVLHIFGEMGESPSIEMDVTRRLTKTYPADLVTPLNLKPPMVWSLRMLMYHGMGISFFPHCLSIRYKGLESDFETRDNAVFALFIYVG